MDEAFGIGGLIEQERKRIDKPLRRTQVIINVEN